MRKNNNFRPNSSFNSFKNKRNGFNKFGLKAQNKNNKNKKNKGSSFCSNFSNSFNSKKKISINSINNNINLVNFENLYKQNHNLNVNNNFISINKVSNKNNFKSSNINFNQQKLNKNKYGKNFINKFNSIDKNKFPNIRSNVQSHNNNNNLFLKNNKIEKPIIVKSKNDINSINLFNNNSNNSIKMKLGRPKSTIPYGKHLNEINISCANGLVNVGATCYMNATIQCLAHIEKLTKYLLKKQNNFSNKRLTNAFIEVLKNIWQNKQIKSYSPNKFKNIISEMNPLFEGVQANDSKDLIIFIMETIHNELNTTNNINISSIQSLNQYDYNITFNNFANYFANNFNSIISHLFYGMYNSLMRCLTCNIITNNIQCFNILIFPLEEVRKFKNRIQNIVDITECFEFYQKSDYMMGSNQIYCNNCHVMSNSINMTKIIISPYILVINLNRGKGLQYNVKLNFEEYLDINNFVYYPESPKLYKLIGIVTNFGPSSMSGHFIAFCQSFVDQKWYKYNDAIVSNSSFEEARSTGVPYILFYSYI